MQILKRIPRQLLPGPLIPLTITLLFGILVGGLLFVGSPVPDRDEMRIVEGRPLVTVDSAPTASQSVYQFFEEHLRGMRFRIGNIVTRWAPPESSQQSWSQETNFLDLRIKSKLETDIQDAGRSVSGGPVASLSPLTDDKFAVVTRNGTVLVYGVNDLTASRRIKLPGITASSDVGTGIHAIALRSFANSTAQMIATYGTSEVADRECTRIHVISFAIRLDGSPEHDEHSASEPETLWTSRECVPRSVAHGSGMGGRLFLTPPNRLYLTLGDLGSAHPKDSIFTSLLEFVFEDGKIVKEPNVISKGFRNPSGLTVAGGHVYVASQGPKGGDTINLATPGKDFGWPTASYGAEYAFSGYPSPSNSIGDFDAPSYVWVPSPAVSDLDFNRTASLDTWFNEEGVGDLLLTSLKARSLYRCRTAAHTGQVVYCEKIFIGERLRGVLSLKSALILLSDSGRLYRISRA